MLEWLSDLSDQSKSCLAGGLSGTCSALLFQPLELAKTRLQQNIVVRWPSPNASCASTKRRMWSELPKLWLVSEWWRGTSASVLRVLPGAAIYFGCLHALTTARKEPRSSLAPLEALCVGTSARAMAALALMPLTVVKTRFESNLYSYTSVGQALKLIWRREGRTGLSCGLSATLLRDAPYSGLVFMFYSQLKSHTLTQTQSNVDKEPTMKLFLCALTAGILASLVTHPLDVIKTQMQLRPDQFTSLRLASVAIWKQRGVRGFAAGITARMARRTLMSATSWTLYDEISRKLKLR